MASNIILYNGPTSPFGRKCKIAANILQIPHEEKIINVYQSDFLDSFNPLRQIPTLVADGQVIADSDNICLYFDNISSQNLLFHLRKKTQIFMKFLPKNLKLICKVSLHGMYI